MLADDTVIAASADGSIHGFDAANGSVRWSIPRVASGAAGTATAPTIAAGGDFRALARSGRMLVAGSLTGRIVAYDLRTRRERWQHSSPEDGSAGFSIAADDAAVYIPYVSGRLVSLSLADGTERWRTGGRGGFLWPPSSFRQRLYVASTEGFLALRR